MLYHTVQYCSIIISLILQEAYECLCSDDENDDQGQGNL